VKKVCVFLVVLSVALFCQCGGKKARGPEKPGAVESSKPDSSKTPAPPAVTSATGGSDADTTKKSENTEPERELTPKELKDRNMELEERVGELKELNNNLKKTQDKIEKENGNIKNTVAELERVIADNRAQNDQLLKDKDQSKRQIETYRQKIDGVTAMYRDAKSFDELVKNSTKQTAERDMGLFEENSKEKKVLTDLRVCFSARELLEQPYNDTKIRLAKADLDKIDSQSDSLEALRENIGRYRDCGESLKKALAAVSDVDKNESSNRVPEMQERKFGKIAVIMGNYMSKNYDYAKFPYLSDIVSKIMQRKGINADANIEDLQKKLQ